MENSLFAASHFLNHARMRGKNEIKAKAEKAKKKNLFSLFSLGGIFFHTNFCLRIKLNLFQKKKLNFNVPIKLINYHYFLRDFDDYFLYFWNKAEKAVANCIHLARRQRFGKLTSRGIML